LLELALWLWVLASSLWVLVWWWVPGWWLEEVWSLEVVVELEARLEAVVGPALEDHQGQLEALPAMEGEEEEVEVEVVVVEVVVVEGEVVEVEVVEVVEVAALVAAVVVLVVVVEVEEQHLYCSDNCNYMADPEGTPHWQKLSLAQMLLYLS